MQPLSLLAPLGQTKIYLYAIQKPSMSAGPQSSTRKGTWPEAAPLEGERVSSLGLGQAAVDLTDQAAVAALHSRQGGDHPRCLPSCESQHLGLSARVLVTDDPGAKDWPRTAFGN